MSDDPKPPYVMFETRAIEDREATIEAGHFVAKDVTYVIVTPAGTKDRIEKVAADWIAGLREMASQERVPSAWVGMYENALKHWENTQAMPEFGTPIRNWPGVSPAQAHAVIDANVRTVEELAEATEEAISRIGMGGRALKMKAIAWLESSKNSGALAEEVTALRVENEALKERDSERETELKALSKRLDEMEKAQKK